MDPARDLDDRAATIDSVLAEATVALATAGAASPRLDAELLLTTVLNLDRAALYTRGGEVLSKTSIERIRGLLQRRLQREPVQYIVGRQEFWSLDFVVTPNVLIPRPETELLVELVLGLSVPQMGLPVSKGEAQRSLRICDVGTGSGCIAVALAHELPTASLWALDLSMRALAVAELNAQRLGLAGRIRFLRSDLLAGVSTQRFDIIVSNPPYLSATDQTDLQPELTFEPRVALYGGADGVEIIRRLLATAPENLVAGGWLLMEIGATQAATVAGLARAAGFSEVSIRSDYAGLPRVLMARG